MLKGLHKQPHYYLWPVGLLMSPSRAATSYYDRAPSGALQWKMDKLCPLSKPQGWTTHTNIMLIHRNDSDWLNIYEHCKKICLDGVWQKIMLLPQGVQELHLGPVTISHPAPAPSFPRSQGPELRWPPAREAQRPWCRQQEVWSSGCKAPVADRVKINKCRSLKEEEKEEQSAVVS